MSTCKGFTLKGAKCCRKSTLTGYCWQHHETEEIKQINLDGKIDDGKVIVPIVEMKDRIVFGKNLLHLALEPNIILLLHSFVEIPENINKVFNLSARLKWNILHNYFQREDIEMKFPIPTESHLNKLYNYHKKGKDIIQNVKILLKSEIFYEPLYMLYVKKLNLLELCEFMIYLFKNKFYKYFYMIYPEFKNIIFSFGYNFKDYDACLWSKFPFREEKEKITYNVAKKVKVILAIIYMDILFDLQQYDIYDILPSKVRHDRQIKYHHKIIFYFNVDNIYFFTSNEATLIYNKYRSKTKKQEKEFEREYCNTNYLNVTIRDQ